MTAALVVLCLTPTLSVGAATNGGVLSTNGTSDSAFGHADSRNLLGLSQAEAAFNSTWPRFLRDADDDSDDLTNVLTPHALRVLVGNVDCPCTTIATARTSVELTAPIESSYPLSFLVDINNPTATEVVNGVTKSTK